MRNTVSAIAAMLVLSCGIAVGQEGQSSKTNTRFSSIYTNLKTQCGSAMTRKEEREAEESGMDIPTVCKGYGGYEIFITSDGGTTQLQVRVKSRKVEKDVVITEGLHISDPIHTQKVEWRLANGKPFAVIFRRNLNEELDDPAMAKKIGEGLRVIGIRNDAIDFTVDLKSTPNPNREARRLADEAYVK